MFKLATGVTTDQNNRIEILKSLTTSDPNAIMDYVFPPTALADPMKNVDQLKGSALLCPTNDETFQMNNMLLVKILCLSFLYYNFDRM